MMPDSIASDVKHARSHGVDSAHWESLPWMGRSPAGFGTRRFVAWPAARRFHAKTHVV